MPDYVDLEPAHLEEMRDAVQRLRARYPKATPRFDGGRADAHLARALWLEWWMNWALENCERPAIYNA